ncbi:ABC transporter permease [Paramicrobacterium agarici]|uniref:Putative ABC transport system permease protein n=1 Tax=Paramicrobacterium agarici TaxID=630514 RepID=A0A2A9DY17_9MICO|nr:ABC transporter permease [Microbacterium agarici]PFG31221.1 putative ABC transport system permease protein [Microbacterium agarici]
MILSARDLRSTALVAALSAGFGVALLQGTSVLVAALGEHDVAARARMQLALTVVAAVFFAIAVFVGAIVTSNTVRTVVAGRTRDIARLRLLGASARSIRRGFLRTGLVASAIGSTAGGLLLGGICAMGVPVVVNWGMLPDAPYVLVQWTLVLPVIITIVTCVAAIWLGSRSVLAVSPIEATGRAATSDPITSPWHTRSGVWLLGGGVALLAGGVIVGQVTSTGLLIAVLGGMASFLGVVLLAEKILPPVLGGVGKLLSMGPASRLSATNALRDPGRTSRATIGIVIGVTLIVMFSVAMETYYDVLFGAQSDLPELYRGTDTALSLSIAVFSVLFGFSAVIAAVGLVNTLSLSVLQRRRELGLLRTIGLSRRPVRTMVTVESITMSISGVILGFALGIGYGWSGAMALLGSIPGGRLVSPVIPLWLMAAVIGSALLLAVMAALLPVRRVLRDRPIAALAAE